MTQEIRIDLSGEYPVVYFDGEMTKTDLEIFYDARSDEPHRVDRIRLSRSGAHKRAHRHRKPAPEPPPPPKKQK